MANPGLWKIVIAVGLGLALIGFILGWIGFGVPDWHGFQRYNGSQTEYYGLWAYCQQSTTFFTTICRRWPDAQVQLFNGTRPNFVSAADGLVTTGMILFSLGIIGGLFALILPVLSYLAGALLFLAFLFIVIGVPIFGVQSNNLSTLRNDATYGKRYGFGLMIAALVLAFVASILYFLAGFLYQKFGFGNFATPTSNRNTVGGQRLLGPANLINPGYMGGMPNQNLYAMPAGFAAPSLLSQYIAQRMPRYYGPPAIRQVVVSALPQPSAMQSISQPVYVTPAYYRAPAIAQPAYTSLVNLSGTTLAGPVIRLA